MSLTLLYSVIKRISFLSRRLSSSHSYYFHIIFGGVGALLIMIHSSFEFRSVNSTVAIVSMLLILVSGALGRYLYTQFSLLLHRLYLDVKKAEPALYNNIYSYNCNAAKRVNGRLSELVQHSFNQPKNFFDFLARSITVVPYGIYTYVTSLRDIYRIIRSASILGDLEKQDVRNIRKSHKKELRQYVFKIIKMGYLSLMGQLFHNWRILHVPFLYVLVLTSLVHVVVVHMY